MLLERMDYLSDDNGFYALGPKDTKKRGLAPIDVQRS